MATALQEIEDVPIELSSIVRLSKDLREAAVTMTETEVRYLVDGYYATQGDRIRYTNQVRSLAEAGEPFQLTGWLAKQAAILETQIKHALDDYSAQHPVGEWMREQVGIGEVIASGFLAHIDIKKAPTVGHIWSFAGLVPGVEWKKGEKRPWNADLKVLCYKAGESFVKTQNHPDSYYGRIYADRKKLEVERNETGKNKEQAAKQLAEKNYGKTTDAYANLIKGKLPQAQIHARARRIAVKLFISHFHDVWYRYEFGVAPPMPYPIVYMGHAHYIPPPGSKPTA